MPNPTEILSNEHQYILKVLGALSAESDALRSGKELDRKFFEQALDFIKNFADKFHHAKEEAVLFVELGKDEVEMHCNPMGQMVYEHDLGRGFVKGMEAGLTENNRDKILSNAQAYTNLLQEHIFKEDNILFPMAEEALNETAKELVCAKFLAAEQALFGQGTKEKYLALARDLGGSN